MTNRRIPLILTAVALLALARADAAPHGGGGGAPFSFSCGANEVLVAFDLRVGQYVDRIDAKCYKITHEKKWEQTGSYRSIGAAGGMGGAPSSLYCDSNSAVVGLHGRAQQFLNAMGPICWRMDGTGSDYTRSAMGGGAGTSFNDRCPSGQVAVGIKGRAGNWIDQVELVCGAIPTPPAPATTPFTLNMSANPSSSSAQYLECNTAIQLTLTGSGGPASGTTEFRFTAYRMFYDNTVTSDQIFFRDWATANSASWTPSTAGYYKVRGWVRRSGVEAQTDVTVWVRMGLTITANPTSPAPSPQVVQLSVTPVCQPTNSTAFYAYELAGQTSGTISANSWTTPATVAAGTYTARVRGWAVRDSSTYSANKQIAISQDRTISYQVNAGGGGGGTADKFADTLFETFSHPRCTNCHGMAKGNSVWTAHIVRLSGENATTNASRSNKVNNSANCTLSTCHANDSSGWKAPRSDVTPDFDFAGLTATQVCEKIKSHISAAETMRTHLKNDTGLLLVWAITNGVAAGNNLGKAPPADRPTWESKVDTWVNGGMKCQ